MKKFLLIIICMICLVTGCGKETYEQQSLNNISINIKDITPTSATIVIKDTNESSYTYSEWYEIEKEVDSKWEKLEVNNDMVFNDKGYKVDGNNTIEFDMNWEDYYGSLEPGNYRLIKRVDNNYLYTYFTIENDYNNE